MSVISSMSSSFAIWRPAITEKDLITQEGKWCFKGPWKTASCIVRVIVGPGTVAAVGFIVARILNGRPFTLGQRLSSLSVTQFCSLFGGMVIGRIWAGYEHSRLQKSVHKTALRLFQSQQEVDVNLIDYFVRNPIATQQLANEFKNNPQQLNKVTGQTLLDKILEDESDEAFESFKHLAAIPEFLNEDTLEKIVKSDKGDIVKYIIQNELITLTEGRKRWLWLLAQSPEVLKVLYKCQYRENREAISLPAEALKKELEILAEIAVSLKNNNTSQDIASPKLFFLLSLGAIAPNFETEFAEAFEDQPRILAALKQAQSHVGLDKYLKTDSIFDVRHPVVYANTLLKRVCFVAVSIFSVVWLTKWRCPALSPVRLTVLGAFATISYVALEFLRTIKHNSIRELEEECFPRAVARKRILGLIPLNPQLAVQLGEKNLTKLDDTGVSIADEIWQTFFKRYPSKLNSLQFFTFKTLADVLFTENTPKERKAFYLHEITKSGHQECITYLLEEKKVEQADFGSEFAHYWSQWAAGSTSK
jgi:hypothetical protein